MGRIRDQRPANVDYYRRNRDQELFRVRARQAGTREMLREWRTVPCTDCGETYEPHQMDFDHRDPNTKLFNLTAGRVALMSTAKLREEASKCDVVCANCHRVRTLKSRDLWATRQRPGTSARLAERKRAWRVQAAILLELRSVPCTDCGRTYPPVAMDFDHREGQSKKSGVMNLVSRAGLSEILAEVAKCDVVCANCHRMRTYRRRELSSGRSSVG